MPVYLIRGTVDFEVLITSQDPLKEEWGERFVAEKINLQQPTIFNSDIVASLEDQDANLDQWTPLRSLLEEEE